MDTFTGISECISCNFKSVFMAIYFLVLSIKNIGWMDERCVLGHFYALSRLNWAGDNLG